jgi:hypothetical protein
LVVDDGKVNFDERATELRGILIRVNEFVVDVEGRDRIDDMGIF